MPKICGHTELLPDTCRICYWCSSCSREGRLYRKQWGEPDLDCGDKHVEPEPWGERDPNVYTNPPQAILDAFRNPPPPKPQLLGDKVESALSKVGITKERVTEWLGRPCGCTERQNKLNKLDEWARETASDTIEKARGWLHGLLGVKEEPQPPST